MDRVRVFETGQGLNAVQAELFPDISIGDAPRHRCGACRYRAAATPRAAAARAHP